MIVAAIGRPGGGLDQGPCDRRDQTRRNVPSQAARATSAEPAPGRPRLPTLPARQARPATGTTIRPHAGTLRRRRPNGRPPVDRAFQVRDVRRGRGPAGGVGGRQAGASSTKAIRHPEHEQRRQRHGGRCARTVSHAILHIRLLGIGANLQQIGHRHVARGEHRHRQRRRRRSRPGSGVSPRRNGHARGGPDRAAPRPRARTRPTAGLGRQAGPPTARAASPCTIAGAWQADQESAAARMLAYGPCCRTSRARPPRAAASARTPPSPARHA